MQTFYSMKKLKQLTCRNLSVKICTDQSNKVKTSDKQMHVAFCDNSFNFKISSDKLERRSDELIHVRSIACMSNTTTKEN